MYLVSILVPVYGVEKYIERCIRSLFEQSYQNLEYIFVDDCSPDRSIDILKQISQEYPERTDAIKIVRHKKNRGLAAARNTAVENAKGLFVCHVDSDDYLEIDAIKLLVNKQIENDSDIVTGSAIKHLKEKDILIEGPKYLGKDKWIKELLRTDQIYNHVIWRRLIRLSLYTDNHIKNKEGSNQGEDWQVTPQLAYYAQKVDIIDNVIYHYDCTNENSLCANNSKANIKSWQQDINSVKYMVDFFDDKEPLFAHISKDTAMITMRGYLYLSVKYGEKAFFYHLLTEMSYSNNYAAIGWDKSIKYYFNRWYCGMRMYYRMKSFVKYVIKHIR